jgi:hypothetical protein
VHQGRKTYHAREDMVPDENILCIGSSRKRPVLKWEGNIALPGNLTLTEKALYFEVTSLSFAKLCVFWTFTLSNDLNYAMKKMVKK